jgi:hypothetical protein
VFLLRTGAVTAEDYKIDVARSEQELALVFDKMNDYKDAEGDMLQYVLSFSELVKQAGKYYRLAVDSEKRELVMLAFSELSFSDGAFRIVPQKAFADVFFRCRDTKNTQNFDLSASSGSELVWFSELHTTYRLVRESYPKLKEILFSKIVTV